jgi:16S rRNA G527 N7-methylase RsmG
MRMTMRDGGALAELEETARAVGRPLDEAATEALVRWADLVIEWRRAAQLTSLVQAGEVVSQLMEPALYALKVTQIRDGMHIVDFGCGNGCTGIALALATRAGSWTLLDHDEKKVVFCRYAIGRCRMEEMGLRVRAEPRVAGGHADVVLMRATPRSASTREAGDALLRPGGTLVRWLPTNPPERGAHAVRCGERRLWVVAWGGRCFT